MFAVQAEAVGAFKRKDWVALITLLGGVKGVGAQLGAAWAELELGRIDEGVARIRELFAAVSGPLEIAPTLPWSLWSLRKHVGPSRLMEWGLHDAVIERLWLELRDLPVDPSNAFAKEWVDGGLLAFMTALPERARPPVPWQLGGVAAVLSDEAWAQVLAWARGEAKAIGVGARSTFWALERAASSSPGSVGERVRALGAFGYEVSVLAKDEAMRRLGETLDARLLLEDVRPRVPAAVRERVKRVLFRATPRRVVDAVVVELVEPGQFGALVRHLVPAGDEGKTTAELAWVEGSKEDVVAAVPAGAFEAAVRALLRSS